MNKGLIRRRKKRKKRNQKVKGVEPKTKLFCRKIPHVIFGKLRREENYKVRKWTI